MWRHPSLKLKPIYIEKRKKKKEIVLLFSFENIYSDEIFTNNYIALIIFGYNRIYFFFL